MKFIAHWRIRIRAARLAAQAERELRAYRSEVAIVGRCYRFGRPYMELVGGLAPHSGLADEHSTRAAKLRGQADALLSRIGR